MIQVSRNMVVSLRYIMKNGRGDILENTMNTNPTSYLHGSASIFTLLQVQMEGLMAGDKKTVYLKSDQAIIDDDFIFDVVIDEVRKASPEEVELGYPVKLDVKICDADCDCYSIKKIDN